MSEAKIIFDLEGIKITIQCSQEDKIKDICQKYATKIDSNINSLLFLYGGTKMNMELKFKEQANSMDINNNEMNVLVYKRENDDFTCPHCNKKIKLNTEKIDNIILSNNNIKDIINSIKFNIDNIIRISTNNTITIQLKSINLLLNNLNEDINKNNEKLKNLLKENNVVLNINDNNNSIMNKEIKYDDGKYVGQVVNGKREGKGIRYWKNGSRYEGDFKNNKLEGKGIYYFKNGNREMGDWKDDKEIGKHVTLCNNGEVKTKNY